MFLPLLAGLTLLPAKSFDFYAFGPYNPAVPKVERVLGYEVGSRITTFRDQRQALDALLAKAPDRFRTIEYGKSVEGRPLRILVASSPANIARLDSIRKDTTLLAAGEASEALLNRLPVVVWINECIHGNEPASFESAMYLAYTLAASNDPKIKAILDKAIVVINPVYNPDGHERFAVYYNSVATGDSDPGAFEQSEPSIIHGRTNHYRFDMNRDRVAMSQAETRQEVSEFLKWLPQVYVDQHGQTTNYFFPPNSQAVNVNVDRDRLEKWTTIFGRANGGAFDRQGWTYFIRDTFDFYFTGYLDIYATLAGSIGMTYETDGGKQIAKKRADGTTLTLRDGIEKHFIAALTTIQAAVDNKAALQTSFAAFRKKGLTGEHAGKFQRVVVESADPRPLARLQAQLDRMGVVSKFATESFTQPDAHDYWSKTVGSRTFAKGSLVVDMAQPQGQLAKAMLEPGSDFEPGFLKAQLEKKKTAPEGETYPGPDGSNFYDITGWSIPLAHSLRASWCESRPAVSTTGTVLDATPVPAATTVGYALRYRDQDDALAVLDALAAGVKGLATTQEMSVGGVSYPPGTFVFLAARNQDGYAEKLREAAKGRGAKLEALTTSYPDSIVGPGTASSIPLAKPNIAVVMGTPARPADFSGIWYLMDQEFRLPFTPISTDALSGNLNQYSAIIVPGGANAPVGRLKEFARAGGSVIALGEIGWALGSGGFVELKAKEGDIESLPGSLFRGTLDGRSFLSYGYDGTAVAVPIYGDTFYSARKEGGSVLKLVGDKDKLLTGFAFTDSEKNLADTTWAQVASIGRGHGVLFAIDPTERAMWPGFYKMLLNGILFGARPTSGDD